MKPLLNLLGGLILAVNNILAILAALFVPTYIASGFGAGWAIATFVVVLSVMVYAIWFAGRGGGTPS